MTHNFKWATLANFFEVANEILPATINQGSLWLGNVDSSGLSFLQEQRIDVVVNCSKDLPFNGENTENIRIPANDTFFNIPDEDLNQMCLGFKNWIPIIIERLAEGKNVLVHCYAGKQRSAIFVTALLLQIDNLKRPNSFYLITSSPDKNENRKKITRDEVEAMTIHVQKLRPQAFTFGLKCNFWKALMIYFQITI
jgi:protein tyrosine phosphatase